MLFSRKIFCVVSKAALVLGAGLVLCPGMVLAQFGGVSMGGHVGPNTSGGVDEKDPLKNVHQAMALQATSEQAAEFRSLVQSTENANQQLQDLLKDLEKGNDATAVSSHAAELRQALEKARLETRKFVEGFSPAQKSGLKDVAARLLKAESDLGEQEKMLDAADAMNGGMRSAGRAGSLSQALEIFRKEQDALALDMGIVQSEGGRDVAFSIPAFKSSVTIARQPVAITTSAVIFRGAAENGENVFKVETTTDLADLQANLTAILGAQLDKAERCGERIEVQEATLTPADPAGEVVVRLHYARWVCTRTMSNEMAEGNATVGLKLTAGVGANGELQVAAEIGRVQADKFLADLVRSGELGVALQEKIGSAVLAAITNFQSALPPAATSTRARSVRFQNSRADELSAVVSGELRISEDQTKLLANQLKERVASQAVAAH